MNILALTNLYPNPLQPHRAPYNRHQFRMLGELHALRVIAPIAWTDEFAAQGPALPAGRRVIHDGLTVDHPRYWYTPKVLRGMYGRFFAASVRAVFDRVCREHRPDVVFAPWAYPDGYAAVELARRAGIPVVVQVHGSDIRQLDEFPARRAGTALAVSQAQGVIAVSRDLAEGCCRLGAKRERVRVIIDGVDREVFYPGSQRNARARLGLEADVKHLLFVGNLAPVKGVDILLAACSRLGTSLGRWRLHVIGGGPLRAALERQAKSLRLSDAVAFHGPIAHQQLPDWFRAADLFVLPSRSEGVPNVLLESMACGLPFVASDVGGIPEIAHLGESLLVRSERPLELAEAIGQMLDPVDPDARRERARCWPGPRDRREAVAEIAAFLERCAIGGASRFGTAA